jgi:regulator of protease activity HflC (stomatin/prohibitin superfamily)
MLRALLAMVVGLGATGCASAIVEPGHRAMIFDPSGGGLHHEVLAPGRYKLSSGARVDDFDVTYSTSAEDVAAVSVEGIGVDVKIAVIYRPIISELYQLDTEIGPPYYREVIGPEFRSATRGVLATESITQLDVGPEALEGAIETELRRRVAGKHVEISSVVVEAVTFPKEIVDAIRARRLELEEAARAKARADAEIEKLKAQLELETLKAKVREAQGACKGAPP